TDQILERIEPFGSSSFGQLHRRADKSLFIPVLNLPQAHADNAARGLAIVSIHGRPSRVEMKTMMFLKVRRMIMDCQAIPVDPSPGYGEQFLCLYRIISTWGP